MEPSFIVFEGLTAFFKRSGEQYAVSRIEDMEQLLQTVNRRKYDMLLLNPLMIQNSQKQLNVLRNEFPAIKLVAIIYSVFPEQLLQSFDGRLQVTDSPAALHDCIKQVLNSAATSDEPADALSDREIAVLKLMATGNANKEIAEKLNISVNTVITHRKNISQKTGIKSISGLTIYAVVKKFVTLDVLSSDDVE